MPSSTFSKHKQRMQTIWIIVTFFQNKRHILEVDASGICLVTSRLPDAEETQLFVVTLNVEDAIIVQSEIHRSIIIDIKSNGPAVVGIEMSYWLSITVGTQCPSIDLFWSTFTIPSIKVWLWLLDSLMSQY